MKAQVLYDLAHSFYITTKRLHKQFDPMHVEGSINNTQVHVCFLVAKSPVVESVQHLCQQSTPSALRCNVYFCIMCDGHPSFLDFLE